MSVFKQNAPLIALCLGFFMVVRDVSIRRQLSLPVDDNYDCRF